MKAWKLKASYFQPFALLPSASAFSVRLLILHRAGEQEIPQLYLNCVYILNLAITLMSLLKLVYALVVIEFHVNSLRCYYSSVVGEPTDVSQVLFPKESRPLLQSSTAALKQRPD